MEDSEKKIVIYHLFLPVGMVLIMWIVKLVEWHFGLSFYEGGIYPRRYDSLYGIFTMPFVHGDWKHLLSNTVSFLVLLYGILYLLKDVGYKAFVWIFILSGFFTWLIGRSSWHIGASGLIYGFAFFLFLSGILSKNTRMWAISLLVAFLYGGIVWGLFPFDPKISYEGHLSGALAGSITALIYRKNLPAREVYEWETEEDSIDEMSHEEIDQLIDDQLKKNKKH
jgi:membrane associated rhomboid family serine protease